MKKILHIPNFYAPHTGGIESTCKYIIESLPSYEHRVICFSASRSTYTDLVDGIQVRRVGSLCRIARQYLSVAYLHELKKLFEEYKPDLVHFHAPNPLIMLYLLMFLPKSCKLIVHWHSDIVAQKILHIFVAPFERPFLNRADRIFITSPNYLGGSAPLQRVKDKVHVVASAIEREHYALNENEKSKLEDLKEKYKGKKIVFFVGRHVPYKGLKYLLQAERNIRNDCLILIAGKGPLTDSLKKEYVSERIKFLGRLSDEDLKLHLYLADIFAFPSITKNEAFGLVLVEAMFSETPAVTFTIKGSGVNWVNLNGVTGLEVENSNAFLFAQAIDKLLEDDELRARFAKNAKQRVLDNFVMDKIGPQIQSIYSELIG